MASLAPRSPGGPDLELAGTLLAYLSATAAGMGFFLLLARRRLRGSPKQATASVHQAATATEPAENAIPVTPLPSMRELIPPLDPYLLADDDGPVGPAPDEVGMPRWLRPSIRAARHSEVDGRLRGRGH